MATRQTLDEIKISVGECLGKRVVLKTNKGKRKAKTREGIIEKVFPSVFTVSIDQGNGSKRTIAYSYSDILTESVEVTVQGCTESIKVS